MERLRRRVDDTPQEETLARPPIAPPPATAPVAASATVQVIWGPIAEHIAVAGMTAAEARALLQGPYNIAPHANMLVNGAPVSRTQRLAAGDTLEFVRLAGEKGA